MLYTSRGTVTTCLLTLMLHMAWGYMRLKSTQALVRWGGRLGWCQDNSWQCQLFLGGISLPLFQGKASKCSLDGILSIRFQDSWLTHIFQILRDTWISPWYRLHCWGKALSCCLCDLDKNSSLSTFKINKVLSQSLQTIITKWLYSYLVPVPDECGIAISTAETCTAYF